MSLQKEKRWLKVILYQQNNEGEDDLLILHYNTTTRHYIPFPKIVHCLDVYPKLEST